MQKLYAGLDVADKTTAICVIDAQGKVVLEASTATTPEAITATLKPFRRRLKAVAQEAGGKSAWLHRELLREKIPIHSLDARHAHAALKARLNKTDANDALGLATLVARGIFTPAYMKAEETIRIRVVLSLREALIRKSLDLRGSLRMARKLLGEDTISPRRRPKPTARGNDVASAIFSVTRVVEGLRAEIELLNRVVEAIVEESPVCRRLMTIPGVGVITALTYVAAVDDPFRFRTSRDVGPYFGLAPRVFQSGSGSRSGGISHRGDRVARKALFVAARALLINSRSTCSLRRWGLRLRATKGLKVACIAVARRLAVLMHHLWVTEQDFDPAR